MKKLIFYLFCPFLLLSCNNSNISNNVENDKTDSIKNQIDSNAKVLAELIIPAKLLVNIKDISKVKSTFESINYDLLYISDDIIDSFKKNNPQISVNYTTNAELYFDKIYAEEEDWIQYLQHTVVVPVNSKNELRKIKERLLTDTNVVFIQENQPKTLQYVPNDPQYGNLWGLQKLRCDKAWDISEGRDILVGVVDDGTYTNHEDIRSNLWTGPIGNYGFDFTNEEVVSYDVNPAPGAVHGTHVAGTICAIANNNRDIIGVAPLAKIMTLKIGNPSSDIKCLNAFFYAIKYKVRIINNSWGPGKRQEINLEMNRIINLAYKMNILVVFAAGNNNDNVQYYAPANHPRVISVAATDINNRKMDFSNYGNLISVSAPGGNIISLNNPSGVRNMSGTSMSAPHVTGLAALIMESNPKLNVEQIKFLMEETSTKFNPLPNPHIGFGVINANEALIKAKSMQTHRVRIIFSGTITDHDALSGNETCHYVKYIDLDVLSDGKSYTWESSSEWCDGEVWAKLNLSYSMDINRTLQLSGVVHLFDEETYEGSQTFNFRYGADQNGPEDAINGTISDPSNQDKVFFHLIIYHL